MHKGWILIPHNASTNLTGSDEMKDIYLGKGRGVADSLFTCFSLQHRGFNLYIS